MNIVFRTDASTKIGAGHLMRCLSLADTLAQSNRISFICRDVEGSLSRFVEQRGYPLFVLSSDKGERNFDSSEDPHGHWLETSCDNDARQTLEVLKKIGVVDWLIVDHYALNKEWESFFREHVSHILAIDDLPNRPHDCDIILNQNYYEDASAVYEALVPKHCQKLIGPKFSLLRSVYRDLRKSLKERSGEVHRILVFLGASDLTRDTEKVLEAIRLLNRSDIHVDVVVGGNNPNHSLIKEICATLSNTNYHFQIDTLAHLMAEADLFIGAAGATTWERCCMGLPSLMIATAFNQEGIAREGEKAGFGIYLGVSQEVTVKRIQEAIENLLKDPSRVKHLSEHAEKTVDGKGSDRVLEAMMHFNNAKVLAV